MSNCEDDLQKLNNVMCNPFIIWPWRPKCYQTTWPLTHWADGSYRYQIWQAKYTSMTYVTWSWPNANEHLMNGMTIVIKGLNKVKQHAANNVNSWLCSIVIEGRFSPANFPVLRWTCSYLVTTYGGKLSAAGQPTRPNQHFILSGLILNSKLFIGCAPLVQVAPSGECLRGNGCGYLIGLLAA